MANMVEYIRQLEVFDPENFSDRVNVIGAGAVGSWLVLALAKLGVSNIKVWDFDVVESHNLPNQLYGIADVGKPKVQALKEIVKQLTGIDIKIEQSRADSSTDLKGYVFVVTDTMASRDKIYRGCVKLNPQVKFYIETRMGLTDGKTYAFVPTYITDCERYENTLYSDDVSEASACGASSTVVVTAQALVSTAMWRFLQFVNDDERIDNASIIDYRTNGAYHRVWGEKL